MKRVLRYSEHSSDCRRFVFYTQAWSNIGGKYMFGKKKKAAAAAAVAEQRKADLYLELKKYRDWVSAQLSNSLDKEIDFLELTRTGYAKMYEIAERFPEVRQLLDWELKAHPLERCYSWMDEECEWSNWSYEQMLKHQQVFNSSDTWGYYEQVAEKLPEYTPPLTVEFIGPFGGYGPWPYYACAYLSFAYHTKLWYKGIIQKIDDLLT